MAAKECIIGAIQEYIRSAITDSIFDTSDGTESKTVDQIEIHKLLKTVIDAAERPSASDVCDKYKAFIATQFDFRGKLVNAVE